MSIHIKPSASVVPIAEPETPEARTILQGQIDAVSRVIESRVQKQRRLRDAILADDTAGALVLACELVGLSDREAVARVEAMMAAVARA